LDDDEGGSGARFPVRVNWRVAGLDSARSAGIGKRWAKGAKLSLTPWLISRPEIACNQLSNQFSCSGFKPVLNRVAATLRALWIGATGGAAFLLEASHCIGDQNRKERKTMFLYKWFYITSFATTF
jgi:hypothetical protein